MTKQDEIRGGIQKIIDGYDSTLPINEPCPHCAVVDEILSYLHSQGVVLKVDRELPLPKWEEVKGTAVEVDTDTWGKMLAMVAVIYDRAFKAGFEAVEPLIKEEHEEQTP